MTNTDFEDYYNSTFETEYEKLISDFILAFNDTKDGYSTSKKIQKFDDGLPKKRESLTRVYYAEDHSDEDYYSNALIRRFREGKEDYEPDQFYLRFLGKEVSEIKEVIKRNNFKIHKPEIYNADERNTLEFIATFNAHEKFITAYYKVARTKSSDLNTLVEILRGQGKVVNEVIADPITEIVNSKNEFNSRSMTDVVNHFKVLTTRTSINREPFLTNEQFIAFLNKAFLKKADIPSQTINVAKTEKGFVIKRFYEFYYDSYVNFKEINKKEKYIQLLSNNFNNWSFDEIKHFFKSGKIKQQW